MYWSEQSFTGLGPVQYENISVISIRVVDISGAGSAYPSGVQSCFFVFFFGGVLVAQSLCFLVFCRSLFVLLFFSFCHCIVWPSLIYGFWLPFWYLQTFVVINQSVFNMVLEIMYNKRMFMSYNSNTTGVTSGAGKPSFNPCNKSRMTTHYKVLFIISRCKRCILHIYTYFVPPPQPKNYRSYFYAQRLLQV